MGAVLRSGGGGDGDRAGPGRRARAHAVQIIDPTSGPRAALYAHFRSYQTPQFTLCSPVAVDTARLRAEGGIFPNLLHAMLGAAHTVPELRQRIRVEDGADVVVEHARVDCTCTVGRPDGSFDFCTFPWDPDRVAFVADVKHRIADSAAGEGLDLSAQGRDDLLYLTSVPWIDVSSITHASPGDPLDCVPKVLWGKIVEDRMTLCVTAHHGLVDGLHIARFVLEVQRRLGRRAGEGQ